VEGDAVESQKKNKSLNTKRGATLSEFVLLACLLSRAT
jgi:hypothetical protein